MFPKVGESKSSVPVGLQTKCSNIDPDPKCRWSCERVMWAHLSPQLINFPTWRREACGQISGGFVVSDLKANLTVSYITQFDGLGSLSLHRLQTLINVMLLLWSLPYHAMFSVSAFADKAFSTSLRARRDEESHNDRPLNKQLIC